MMLKIKSPAAQAKPPPMAAAKLSNVNSVRARITRISLPLEQAAMAAFFRHGVSAPTRRDEPAGRDLPQRTEGPARHDRIEL